jgi:2-methylisocitrate lyase-like PEP mutase family enzyme
MPTQREKGEAFAALHEGPAFVIPNPWDAGSARLLQSIGFQALATTSSGFAYTLGRADGSVTLDEVVAHVALLCEASDLPVSVDLENGYGAPPTLTRVAPASAICANVRSPHASTLTGLETASQTARISSTVARPGA